jgi:tetratricopeptide (TPR) repeat protein
MTQYNVQPSSDLQNAIERYSQALTSVEAAAPKPSQAEILEVLLARDEVKNALETASNTDTKQVDTIIQLDKRLQKQAKVLARQGDLPAWRTSIKPDESAWWWFFHTVKKVNKWDRLDWVWNLLTAGSLAVTASLFITMAQALAVGGGLSWQQSFVGIAQGTGLLVIAQSSLTSKGQERVKTLLKNAGIPEYLYSEVLFGASALLLIVSYTVYAFLPKILYKQGESHYEQGNLSQAETRYLQALNLDAENSEYNLNLGEVYESLGSLDKALDQYRVAAQDGDPTALNNMGHIYIHRYNPVKRRTTPILAETFLRLGLQRVGEEDWTTQYLIKRNLGWSLLMQKQYNDAEKYLQEAVETYDRLAEKEREKIAMAAECLLTQVHQVQQGPANQLNNLYQKCRDRSLPESVDQYKWFMSVGERRLASCINTTKVVRESDQKNPVESDPSCRGDFLLAPPQMTNSEEIEKLRVQLYDNIYRNWTNRPTFTQQLNYEVTINSDGTIVGYKALGALEQKFLLETPLPKLAKLGNNKKSVTKFQVSFKPTWTHNVTSLPTSTQ